MPATFSRRAAATGVAALPSTLSDHCTRFDVIGFRAGCHQIGMLQPAWRAGDLVLGALAHDPALVDDGNVAAEALDLFQIVRGEKNGAAVLVEEDRGRYLNIGAQGQFIVGAIAAVTVVLPTPPLPATTTRRDWAQNLRGSTSPSLRGQIWLPIGTRSCWPGKIRLGSEIWLRLARKMRR